MSLRCRRPCALLVATRFILLTLVLSLRVLLAEVGGGISGTVTDQQGLLVRGAKVTVVELDTNLKQTATTDSKGFYSLPEMPVGLYQITIEAQGFKQYRETNLRLNASGALLVNASLLVGGKSETITVSSTNVEVESVDTQLGEVIESSEATAVP